MGEAQQNDCLFRIQSRQEDFYLLPEPSSVSREQHHKNAKVDPLKKKGHPQGKDHNSTGENKMYIKRPLPEMQESPDWSTQNNTLLGGLTDSFPCFSLRDHSRQHSTYFVHKTVLNTEHLNSAFYNNPGKLQYKTKQE